MTTDEDILVEMLERVTHPSRDTVDNLAVQMFCMIVQSNNALVGKAHELLVKKMHSNNSTEAVRAIGLLEECMSKGGVEFQKKTAKFNFLNELIALALDKHSGAPASIQTKKRLMECLMLWTVEHQDKPKIQDAYDNIKKQANFTDEPCAGNSNSSDLVAVRDPRSSILGKDDQLVAKLLKQGGVENYKKANLLIQNRFNQEARRAEFICHLKNELKKIEYTMELLDEMLNSCSSDVPEADSRDIMQELYNNCKGHIEQMARWPDFLGETEPEFLEDVLSTKELLSVVIQRYKEIMENPDHHSESTVANASATNTDLISELLGNVLPTSSIDTKPNKPISPIKSTDTMDQLNEIFGTVPDKPENSMSQYTSELFNNFDLLEPISVFKVENSKVIANEKEEQKNDRFKDLNEIGKKDQVFKLSEIDKLSEEMFKRSLKEDQQRALSFKKETKKIALNDLVKDKIQTALNECKSEESNENHNFKLKECDKASETLTADFKDLEENGKEFQNRETKTKLKEDDLKLMDKHKPLAEISIDLDEITPLDDGQRLLFEDEIQVTLNFTADRPSEHVSVIVMTVTNKSKLPVKDFLFEASVKKPCKVRLLPPTDTDLAPRKPFRPSAPIIQVLLLLNPTQKPVDITCIIGYKLGDDPDPIKESIVTKDIPYV